MGSAETTGSTAGEGFPLSRQVTMNAASMFSNARGFLTARRAQRPGSQMLLHRLRKLDELLGIENVDEVRT